MDTLTILTVLLILIGTVANFYLIRRLIREAVRCAAAQLLGRDEEARFRARYNLTRKYGLLKGMYIQAKQPRRMLALKDAKLTGPA